MHRVRSGPAAPRSFTVVAWAVVASAMLVGACSTPSPPLRDAEAAQVASERERELLAVQLVGPTWALVRIQSMGGEVYVPSQPGDFTLRFTADGQVDVRADCNRGHGSWTGDGRSGLTFGPLATTRAYCGDESLDARFLSDLAHVRSVVFTEERMHLATMADGAILEFEALEAGE